MPIIEPEFQNAINEYYGQPKESDFSKFVNNLSRRDTDPRFREEAARADIAKYEQRNQAVRQDPQLYDRIQAKVQQLIERRNSDALSILDAIKSDPDLSIGFPTEPDKDELIKHVQQSIDNASNVYNALNGYNVEGDKGFLSELAGSTWSGIKNTISSPYYAIRKRNAVNELNNLPLNQLDSIYNKINTARQISNKVNETKAGLLSVDFATRSKALRDLQYYKGTLDNLALTEEEQQIWNEYGNKYVQLKDELDTINADKANFTGSKNISADEARVLMEKQRRDEQYKQLGIDPSLGDLVVDAVKDSTSSFGAVGRSLGNVLSSAMAFMIPIPGLGASAFVSTAMEYSADLMEHHLKEYGEMPTEEQLKAVLYGTLAAGIDYFGSKGLVKGLGAGKFFAGIGKTEAMRTAEQIAKNVTKNLEPLRRGMSDKAFSQLYLNTVKNELANVGLDTSKEASKVITKELDKAMNKALYGETLGTKITRKIRELPEGIARTALEAPIKTGKGLVNTGKAIVKGNQYLHETLDVGVQDILKAGAGLALENVGSSLVRQHYKGEYDKAEIAQGIADGFISGGAFHVASNATIIPTRGLTGKTKELWNKHFNGGIDLESKSDFLAQLDILKSDNPSIAKYTPNMGNFLLNRYKEVEKTINDFESGLEKTRNNNALKNAGFAIDEKGKAYVDMGVYNASDAKASNSLAYVEKAVKDYNKAKKIVDDFGEEVHSRVSSLEDALKVNAEKVHNIAKDSEDFSADEKEQAKQRYLDTLSKEEQVKYVQEEQGFSKEEAEEYLEDVERPEEAELPERYTEKVGDTGVSVSDIFKRGNTDVYLYKDILADDAIRDAIVNVDKKAFDDALEKNQAISKERKEAVKKYFTEDKFAQYERGEVDTNTAHNISGLNKAIQKDIKNTLKVPDTEISKEDATKSDDNLKNYVYQQILNHKKEIATPEELGERIRQSIPNLTDKQNEVINSAIGSIKEARDKAIEKNNKLAYRKVYKNKESAEKALKNIIKDNPNVKSYLNVEQVGDNQFVLSDINLEPAINAVTELESKEDLSKQDIKDFIDKYKDSLDALTDKVQDSFNKLIDTYDRAPKEKKAELKKTIVGVLKKITQQQASDWYQGYTTANASKSIQSAVHGYTSKSSIRESRDRKRQQDAEKEKAKIEREQSKVEKEAKQLTTEQASAVMYDAYERLISQGVNFDDASTWESINRFTTLDILNLQAIIDSGKLDSTRLYQARTLLALIKKTKIIENTTVANLVDPIAGTMSVNKDWTTVRQSLPDINTKVREAYKNKYGEDVPANYLSTPESLMADSEKEHLFSAENQRRANSILKFKTSLNQSTALIKKVFKQLDDFDVITTKGRSSVLNLICKECKTAVTYPTNINNLSRDEARKLFLTFLKESPIFRRALGLDAGATQKITSENASRLIEYSKPVDIASLRNAKPSKIVEFNADFGSVDETLRNIYNNSNTTLQERLLALDAIFDADGGFIDTYVASVSDNAAISDMYRDLAIYRRALNSKAVKKANKVLKTLGIDVNKLENKQDLLKAVSDAYTNASDKYTDNRPARVKQALLDALSSKMFNLSTSDKTKSNNRDLKYAKLLSLYNLATTLPEQPLQVTRETEYDPSKVTKAELMPLLYTIVTDDSALYTVTNFINGLKTFIKFSKKDEQAIKNALMPDGYVDVTGNNLSELSDELQTRLAQALAIYFNNNIKQYTTVPSVTVNNTKTNPTKDLTFDANKSPLKRAVSGSSYDNDLEIRPNSILCTENVSDSITSNNKNYAPDTSQVNTVLKFINDLNIQGTKFLDSGYAIDEIFGAELEGRIIYSKEFLSVLSATGLNNLFSLKNGQSEDWVSTMVGAKKISEKAGYALLSQNFSDYQTTAVSLGKQALHSLGLHIKDEQSLADIEDRVCAEVGSRILHLLESAGYIQKQYLTYNGGFSSTQPTEGEYIRVLKLTQDGDNAIDAIKSASDYSFTDSNNLTKTGHILDDLLGSSKEREARTGKEFIDSQKSLENRFNADSKVYTSLEPKTITMTYLNNKGEEKERTYTVTTIPFSGLTKVELKDKDTIRKIGNEELKAIYLDRRTSYKVGGTLNSPHALVELAYKNTEGQVVNRNEYKELFHDTVRDTKEWYDLPEYIQKALGMDTKETVGINETFRRDKNKQIFRMAKEFDANIRQYNNGDIIYFPVTMTPNNRFLVDSPRFNYREFKPMRDFFNPADTLDGNVRGGRNEAQQTMLKATVLFNLGLDVDKMLGTDIDRVFNQFRRAFKNIKAADGGITALEHYVNNTVTDADKKILAPLTSITFNVYKGSKEPKGFELNGSVPCHLLFRNLINNDAVLDDIKDNQALTNFNYRIEVDGLNNGSGHHFSQSGVFTNTDSISTAKAVAVGVFPPSISGNFGDFIKAMSESPEKYLDVYMLSARTGEELAKEDFTKMIIEGLAKDKDKVAKIQLLKLLAEVYDAKDEAGNRATEIEDTIPKLLSRDVMKKVAMPSTYGAGMQALLNHLASGIDKELGKYIYKLIKDKSNRAEANETIKTIYNKLRDLNGGYLSLVDMEGKEVSYKDVMDSPDLYNYLPVVINNTNLFNLLKDTCLVSAVKGAKSVTEEATERARVLNQANEAICTVFKASVKRALETHYKDRDIRTLTWADHKQLLSIVATELNFGTQEQTLDVLKPALMGALTEITYNKVSGYYEGGQSSVRYTTDLDKESLGSVLPPVFIHGFDAGNIAYAQQLVRDTLKAFTGIHDAVMINYKQFTGDGFAVSVPEAMNKGFIEGALTAYEPLIYMAYLLKAGLDHVPELGVQDVSDIRYAISELESYACMEIDNAQKMLYAIQKGETYKFNQFGFTEETAFTPDAEWANEQLKKLEKRISTNKVLTEQLQSYNSFLEFLRQHKKGSKLYDTLKNNKDIAVTVFSVDQLKEAIRIKQVPTSGISQKDLDDLFKAYDDYIKGADEVSYYRTFLNGMSELNKARGDKTLGVIKNGARNPKGTKDIVSGLISLIRENTYNDNISDDSYVVSYLSSNFNKLTGLLHKDANSYHILAGLIRLTSSNRSINTNDLNRLVGLLESSGLADGSIDSLTTLDKNKESLFIDVSDINLGDFLNHITLQSQESGITGTKQTESTFLHNILDGYVDRIEKQLEATGAKQIIFRMDSAVDLMLFSILNATKNEKKRFKDITFAIAPNITNQAGVNVDKDVATYNFLNDALGAKLHDFTVLNSTENKNLELQNFKYNSQFTRTGMVGQYVRETYAVKTDSKGQVIRREQLGKRIDKDNPIHLANYYGEIESTNTTNTASSSMLYVQRSANDIKGILEYENRVLNFNAPKANEEADKKKLGDVSSNQVQITATNFNEIVNGKHLVFTLNTDGTFTDDRVYNFIKNIKSLSNAYKLATSAYKRMEQRFANDDGIGVREAIYQPITLDNIHLNNLTNVSVTFIVTSDNKINVKSLLDSIEGLSPASSSYIRGKNQFVFKTGDNKIAKARIDTVKQRFKSVDLNDPSNSFSNWIMREVKSKYDEHYTDAQKATAYVTIPKYLRSSESGLSFTAENINKNAKYDFDGSNTVYFGTDASPDFGNTAKGNPTVYSFETVRGIKQQQAISDKFITNLKTGLVNRFEQLRTKIKRYTNNPTKSEEDMTVYDKAVYKDLTCEDSTSLFNTLVQDDTSRGLDTSHLSYVFDKLRNLNMNVRYYLNDLAYSQGGAFIETINAKPTGYINFNARGTGSHAEVFLHEWSHIPLEYLKYDANAYRLATQLYQFSAKNLTLEDFECSTDEAKRIYNYIFRDNNTVDPQIEFITYSLTNSDFRKALDNMAERESFKDEFNAKKESVLARFVNKVSGSLNKGASNNINNMVFDIFKRSVDLCNEYQQKVPVDEEAYTVERLQLSNADTKIYDALKDITKAVGLDTVSNTLGTLQGMEEEYDTLRNISRNEQTRNANPDVLPAILDTFGSVKGAYSDVYNQLRQSFEGVSDGNYSYVKLRYQAKETIDKARENSASALNEVVRNLTKDISQKTLNEMTNHVLKADMSCLLDDGVYDKDTLNKVLTDSRFRNQEINRIKQTLSKSNMGNYFINASKGLVDKLTIGVNTSGIGYNNAYEIANISGSSIATLESPYTKDIDKLITLQVMDYYDKQNPNVYKELSKNLDSLVEILNIHSGLKKLEYSDVYANSMQKVHIPKGELHGGKVHNRYAVVPKSQLKAYEYAGYTSLGKAKLDSFYNNITTEDFYKVQAKYMPDVPYVDGIPVLTDVFNGRNKTGTYLGGKKLESTQINPMFHNTEFNALTHYIQNRVNMLNSPNYFATNAKDLDGVITPTYGIGNTLKGCDFQLNEVEQNKYLNRHVKFTSALGDHYGSIIERTRAPEWNMEASQALDDLYQQRRDKYDFTWLNESNENPDLVEAYKLLPFEMKKFFNDKYNGKGVPVETRYLTGIVGYREMSASKVDLEWNNKLRHSVTDYISHIFHNGYIAKGETLLRYLTKLGKENIVIKGVAVSVDNILSNNVTLGVLGLSPKQVCNYQIEGLNNLLKYKEMSRERYMLKTKEITSSLTEQDRARLRGLEASMHDLPISYLAEHGAMPTIAEDITESDRLAKDLIDTHLPKELQTFAHNVIGDQKSWLYRHLSDLATFGDITARYALFKHLTEDKHINNEEAFRQCMQTFVDYSNPLPKGLQYFDSIGALPFTKFLLGNQTNVLNSLVKKPSRALMGIMASSVMGVPSIYDSILGLDSFTNRWKVPGFGLMYDSLGSLPINRAFDVL